MIDERLQFLGRLRQLNGALSFPLSRKLTFYFRDKHLNVSRSVFTTWNLNDSLVPFAEPYALSTLLDLLCEKVGRIVNPRQSHLGLENLFRIFMMFCFITPIKGRQVQMMKRGLFVGLQTTQPPEVSQLSPESCH